jgi:hypothetical protein
MVGMTWERGRGFIILEEGALLILQKPDLSFEFDALYYKDGVAMKVLDDDESGLAGGDVHELESWIKDQLELPLIVNGVDAAGNYLEGVPLSAVIKTVSIPPPGPGWRYDFTAGEGDHWVQLH